MADLLEQTDMGKRKPVLRNNALGACNPYVPREIFTLRNGLRPSIKHLIDLIDTTDPAWPHVAAVLREFVAAGIETDEITIPLALKLGKQRFSVACTEEPALAASHQPTLASVADSIVYYIRRGHLIKIGTTTEPAQRFRDLMPDEILAIEPGGEREEKMRHRQFMHLQQSGEYFQDATELRDHIRLIRSLHGDPDPSWRTTSSRSRIFREPLPVPTSTETITAIDAETELGVLAGTVYKWARDSKLPLAGRDDQGRRTFYREHVLALRGRMRPFGPVPR